MEMSAFRPFSDILEDGQERAKVARNGRLDFAPGELRVPKPAPFGTRMDGS